MKLWTKEIEQIATHYPLGAQEGLGYGAKVWLKYFNPYGAGTWLITEAEQREDGDWLLYGYCHIFEWEWGYVLLSEIQSLKINVIGIPLGLERDLYLSDDETVNSCVNRQSEKVHLFGYNKIN